ncbi:hypothetical protein STEG23_007185 [Scotinomys teguina]
MRFAALIMGSLEGAYPATHTVVKQILVSKSTRGKKVPRCELNFSWVIYKGCMGLSYQHDLVTANAINCWSILSAKLAKAIHLPEEIGKITVERNRQNSEKLKKIKENAKCAKLHNSKRCNPTEVFPKRPQLLGLYAENFSGHNTKANPILDENCE